MTDGVDLELVSEASTALEDWQRFFYGFAESSEQSREMKPLPSKNTNGSIGLLHISEVVENPMESEWTVEDVLPRSGLITLNGKSGTGKTFVAISLGLSSASGLPWMGHAVSSGPVIYVCGEAYAGLHNRLLAWCEHHGMEIDNLPFYIQPRALDLVGNDAHKLIAEVKETSILSPVLVIIDTLDTCFGEGDDSSTTDMRRFLTSCHQIEAELGAAVLIVTHPGHKAIHRERGASNLAGAVDIRYQLDSDKGRGGLWLQQVKNKDGDLLAKKRIKLLPIPASENNRLDKSSCVAVPGTDQSDQDNSSELTANDLLVLETLHEITEEDACLKETDKPNKKIEVSQWRERSLKNLGKKNPNAKPESSRKAFLRARKKLNETNRVQVEGDLVWIETSNPPCQDIDTL